MTSLALQVLGTQTDSVHLIGHYQYMIPQLPVARVRVGLMPVARVYSCLMSYWKSVHQLNAVLR